MNRREALLIATAATLLPACSAPQPLRLGFIAGLSDRGSDVGEGARNGALLALEQRNSSGGIHGQKGELVVQDDGQNATKAAAAMQSLLEARPRAIIGPATSGIASVIVPLANAAKVLLISPTVTGADFVGKDDYFFRINGSVFDYGGRYAEAMHRRGLRQVAAAVDLNNRSFTQTWLSAFRARFTALGGAVVADVGFESQKEPPHAGVVQSMLAAKPDGLLFIATAVDTARLAQQAAKFAPGLPLATTEWASTELLIEHGGRSVERMLVAQAFNRDDTSTRFQTFRTAYVDRFKREPGYSAVNAYDAATVVMDALAQRDRDEELKAALIRLGPFGGLQQQIRFDAYGDTTRLMYFTEVRDGRFVLL